MRRFDAIIVGQGLAGTTLAWALHRAGFRAAVIDRGAKVTASRIAAGLITPVTGQRMAASWRFAELFPFAESFYRDIEKELGVRFFHRKPMVRLFVDAAERSAFEARAETLLRGLVRPLADWSEVGHFHAEHGGFEMPTAARLDVPAYLDATRSRLESQNAFVVGDLDPTSDVVSDNGGISLPRFEIAADWLIWCQGYEPNVLFPAIPFNAVKGEVLTVISNAQPEPVVHQSIWFAPLEDNRALVGSTYDRDVLDSVPTASGRALIEDRLRNLLRPAFEVIDHRAGVRPVLLDGKPILGLHPHLPRLGVFNGLGSKGSLLAPFFATQLAAALAGSHIDRDVSLARVRSVRMF